MSSELQNILLSPIPLDRLIEQLRAIVKEEMSTESKGKEEKLISPDQACKIFDPAISKTTLNKWEHAGYLKLYRIGGRTYFRHSEIIEAAKTFKKYHVGKPVKQ